MAYYELVDVIITHNAGKGLSGEAILRGPGSLFFLPSNCFGCRWLLSVVCSIDTTKCRFVNLLGNGI